MKTILATAATAGIALGAPAFAFEPESDQTIKLMQADWTSMLINTEILNIILSTYGYDVEKVIADDSARYPGFESGDLTMAVETWQTTQDKAFNASVGTGKVLDMGELGPVNGGDKTGHGAAQNQASGGGRAPWRARSPDSWRGPWRIGPQGQSCARLDDGGQGQW